MCTTWQCIKTTYVALLLCGDGFYSGYCSEKLTAQIVFWRENHVSRIPLNADSVMCLRILSQRCHRAIINVTNAIIVLLIYSNNKVNVIISLHRSPFSAVAMRFARERYHMDK